MDRKTIDKDVHAQMEGTSKIANKVRAKFNTALEPEFKYLGSMVQGHGKEYMYGWLECMRRYELIDDINYKIVKERIDGSRS